MRMKYAQALTMTLMDRTSEAACAEAVGVSLDRYQEHTARHLGISVADYRKMSEEDQTHLKTERLHDSARQAAERRLVQNAVGPQLRAAMAG